MNKHIYEEGLDWESRGYMVDARFSSDFPSAADPDANLWRLWAEIFEQAKRGVFSRVSELINTCQQVRRSWILERSCLSLMGDAGNEECFRLILREMQGVSDYTKVRFCASLAAWGNLSLVPQLVSIFEANHEEEEAEVIAEYLSLLMEQDSALLDASKTAPVARYCDLALTRYEKLKQLYKTDQILVIGGEPFSLGALTKLMLRQISERRFNPELRRKFEATTGLDCSSFYKGCVFQHLTAAALIEGFLASPQRMKFRDGVRYLFGHPLSAS